METLFIIFGSIIALLVALGIARYINFNKMPKEEAIRLLRRYRKIYYTLTEKEINSPYGRLLLKSIISLEKKVNAHR